MNKPTPLSPKIDTTIVVASLKKESSKIIKKIEGFRISDAQDCEQLVQYVKVLRELEDRANEKRKSITDSLTKIVKEINALFKPFLDETAASINLAKQEMLKFENSKQKKEEKLMLDFKKGMKVSTFAAKQAELSTKTKGMSVRTSNVLIITKESLIPREYLIPDEAAILEALKAGKKIPGCSLEEKKTIAV